MPSPQPYRVVIVDDEPLGRQLIRNLLRDHDDVEVVGEAACAEEVRALVEGTEPDLMFLDVQMPGASGLELLKQLGPDAPFVIIVTAHSEFALPAFEVHAVDYLVKPVQRARFAGCIARAKRLITQERMTDLAARIVEASKAPLQAEGAGREYPQRLTFKVRRRLIALNVADISWIEGANQYCKVHSAHGEYLLSKTLAALEPELDPSRFFRIHRSAIINGEHLSEVHSDGTGRYFVRLRSGEELPLGRARRGVLDALVARAPPGARSRG